MPEHQIVRLWKDRHYRASLPTAERSALPDHPAGIVEVPSVDLVGANDPNCGIYTDWIACSTFELTCGSYEPCTWTYNPDVIC